MILFYILNIFSNPENLNQNISKYFINETNKYDIHFDKFNNVVYYRDISNNDTYCFNQNDNIYYFFDKEKQCYKNFTEEKLSELCNDFSRKTLDDKNPINPSTVENKEYEYVELTREQKDFINYFDIKIFHTFLFGYYKKDIKKFRHLEKYLNTNHFLKPEYKFTKKEQDSIIELIKHFNGFKNYNVLYYKVHNKYIWDNENFCQYLAGIQTNYYN